MLGKFITSLLLICCLSGCGAVERTAAVWWNSTIAAWKGTASEKASAAEPKAKESNACSPSANRASTTRGQNLCIEAHRITLNGVSLTLKSSLSSWEKTLGQPSRQLTRYKMYGWQDLDLRILVNPDLNDVVIGVYQKNQLPAREPKKGILVRQEAGLFPEISVNGRLLNPEKDSIDSWTQALGKPSSQSEFYASYIWDETGLLLTTDIENFGEPRTVTIYLNPVPESITPGNIATGLFTGQIYLNDQRISSRTRYSELEGRAKEDKDFACGQTRRGTFGAPILSLKKCGLRDEKGQPGYGLSFDLTEDGSGAIIRSVTVSGSFDFPDQM